ncbi:MAG: MMPL family transporter [Chitinivibrionales bacterium]|nr:MMPL family transporter [Chitinivibrionales bacterium]MBD3358826.1 MMPL family transporter [Chitinivibrionales bacterium]
MVIRDCCGNLSAFRVFYIKASSGGFTMMVEWILRQSRRRATVVIALCILFSGVAGIGILRLEVASQHRVFFDPDSPLLHETEELRRRYGGEENVFFSVAPHQGTIFNAVTLSLVRDIADRCRSLPGAEHVETVADFPVVTMGLGGPTIRPFIPDALSSLSPDRFDTLKSEALEEPLLVNWLVSPDGGAAGINVVIKNTDSTATTASIAHAAQALADSIDRTTPNHAIYVTGGVLIDAAFSEASTRDMKTLAPLMYVIIGLLLFILVPSAWAVGAVLATVALATITAMGLFGWAGMVLTPPTSVVPVIVLVVCVAGNIHVIVGLFHELRRGGGKLDALRLSFERNGMALLVTCVTTTIGFLCLNFSDVPPFRDLGNSAAAGVLASYLYTVSFLPAALALAPLKRITTRWGTSHDLIGLRLGNFVLAHSGRLLVGSLAVSIALSFGATQVRFDDVFQNYFGKGFRFRKDLEKIAEDFAGVDYLMCSLGATASGGLADSAYLARLDELTRLCREIPDVAHVSSLTEVLRKVHGDLFPSRTPVRALPEPTTARRIIRGLHHGRGAKSEFVGEFVDTAASASRLILRLNRTPAGRVREIERRIRKEIAARFPPETKVLIGGTSLVFAHLSGRNATSMLWSVSLSLLLMTIALVIAGRSFKYGLLSLVPNLLPILMGFGLWGLLVGRAGMGLTVVAPITLGVVVDDTVHFLLAYLRGRSHKRLPGCGSVRYAYRHVADAAVFTTIVLAAGFCILAFSGFQPTAQMGMATALTLILALLTDLFLFPPLLRHTCGRRFVDEENESV